MVQAGLQKETPASRHTTSAGKTDPGRVRGLNEDYILLAPDLDLFAVCDGMGGHATGNIASTLAAKSLLNFFEATREPPFDAPRHRDDGDAPLAARRLASAIRKANGDVHEIATSHTRHKGMGSTVVAIHLDGDTVHIAHVGDSRCYRLRDGTLAQLTRDHSLYNEALALKPDLSPERLAKLPKNVVTRALGMNDSVKVELTHQALQPGDLFLLCSDGLSGMIKDDDMLGVLGLSEDLGETAELLVAMANDAGGSDNISVVLVRVESVTVTSQAELDEDLDEILVAPPASTPPTDELQEVPDELPEVLDELQEMLDELREVPDDRSPAPVAEPDEDALRPSRIVALQGAEAGELLTLEQALAEEAHQRAVRRERAPAGLPPCSRCGEPVFPDQDFCIECGAPIG